jgi:putative ABC transport system ATP-binding protein
VVFTSSPLLLDRADQVVFMHDGEVAAVGRHRELVHTEPRYRAVVTRETDEEAALNGVPRQQAHRNDGRSEQAALTGALEELEEIEETA